MITSNKYIDNRHHQYIPIRLKNGITLQCRPEIFQSCPAIIDTLHQDLNDCLRILPRSVHALVRRINIWVNDTYIYGAVDDPRVLKHTAAHHHWQWLETVNDLTAKDKGVEVYNARDYMQMRLHWNGCGLILHELCHLIHQLVLSKGLENKLVMLAFGRVLEDGLYDEVLRRDWASAGEEESDAAYATINHKEFFSELSVAFWSRGYDSSLKRRRRIHDRQEKGKGNKQGDDDMILNNNMELCSPPFMASNVLERREALGYKDDGGWHSLESSWMQGLQNILTGGRADGYGHCNKFFPFTHGQLKEYDPVTFAALEQIWAEIADWEDPLSPTPVKCKGCLSLPIFNQGNDFSNKISFGAKMKLDKMLVDEGTDSASEDSPTDF